MFGIKMPWTKRKEEKAKREQELKKKKADEWNRSMDATRARMYSRQDSEDRRRMQAYQSLHSNESTSLDSLSQAMISSRSYTPPASVESPAYAPLHGRGGSFDGGGASGDWSSSSSSSCDSGSSSSSSDSSISSCSSD
jgi:hypothetical protein